MTRFRTVFAVAVVSLAGCADKLRDERTFTLPADGEREKVLLLKAQGADQLLRVEVTATEPVDVFVLLGKDGVAADLLPPDREQRAIGSKKGVTADSLSVKVPAKESYQVVVGLADKSTKADVKLKLSN